MNGHERIVNALNHREGALPVDFSGTSVTGMHVSVVGGLRQHFGLEARPVAVWEPYQMLGQIDDDLADVLGIDTIAVPPRKTMFGFPNEDWKEWRTPWGQVVLVPELFRVRNESDGSVLIYPQGDVSVRPSGKMPADGYFFDALIRQGPIDEESLDPDDNLQEFDDLSEEDLAYFAESAERIESARRGAPDRSRAAVFNFGGTALGDIALVPAPFEPSPKGIRDIEEWYVSTVARRDYVHEVFRRQTEIAIRNLERVHNVVGEVPDVVFICGTDFGTQTSQFCSREAFDELWAPYYSQMNSWIHEYTSWKTFKHSCGAVGPFIESFIQSGFDILNPVQTSAAGMDPAYLEQSYGDRLVFWGGGVDTQHILPFGTPDEVRTAVSTSIEQFAAGGGFVFSTIHNVQARTPIENVAAMFETISRYR